MPAGIPDAGDRNLRATGLKRNDLKKPAKSAGFLL